MPTDQQLKSALEWARRFGHTETGQAARWLADACREEHATDDGEPITEAWLRSVGGEWDDRQQAFTFTIARRQSLQLRTNGQWWVFCGSTYGGRFCSHKRVKTRGQLRRLCAALGLELKGSQL